MTMVEVLANVVIALAAYLIYALLEARIPADLPPVRADRTLLGQALVNLIENAAKFSPQHAPIRIEARSEQVGYRLMANRG